MLPPVLKEYRGAQRGSYYGLKLIGEALFGLLPFGSSWSSKVVSSGISPSHFPVLDNYSEIIVFHWFSFLKIMQVIVHFHRL